MENYFGLRDEEHGRVAQSDPGSLEKAGKGTHAPKAKPWCWNQEEYFVRTFVRMRW